MNTKPSDVLDTNPTSDYSLISTTMEMLYRAIFIKSVDKPTFLCAIMTWDEKAETGNQIREVGFSISSKGKSCYLFSVVSGYPFQIIYTK